MAASRPRTVALRLSSSTEVVPSGTSISWLSSCSSLATAAATSGSGVTVAVSTTRNCGHQATSRCAVLLLHLDGHVDQRDVVRVVARLDHRRAPVELDEQVVIVSRQHQIDGAGNSMTSCPR